MSNIIDFEEVLSSRITEDDIKEARKIYAEKIKEVKNRRRAEVLCNIINDNNPLFRRK